MTMNSVGPSDAATGSARALQQPVDIAQNTAASRASSSAPDILSVLGHLATPDALVYNNSALTNENNRNFALLNPMSGNYTQFITHTTSVVNVYGVPFRRVEGIHYNTNGTGTRREDGLGWGKKVGDITVFANIRAGDSNLVNSAHGASVNAGFYGPPKALNGLVQKLEQSGTPALKKLGRIIDTGLKASSASGSEFGVAYRGTLQYNKSSKQMELNLSGLRIALADFAQALETVPTTNQGHDAVARSNNREDYLAGANPYNLADSTRSGADGAYRNHGDPVAAIAGNIVQLGHVVNPGSAPVRTNAQAKQVLEEAIDRNFPPLTSDHRRLFGEDAKLLRPDPLNAQQRDQLRSTLATLNQYGLDFGSEKIRAASADAAAFAGTANKQPADRQFVRDVFEGDFRHAFTEDYDLGDFGRDTLIGVNRWVGLAASLDAGSVADDNAYMQRAEAREQGFKTRLDANAGGTLKALGIDTSGLQGAQRDAFEDKVTRGLASVLDGKLSARNVAATSQSLYDEFTRLPAAERQAIAARLNAALR
jgi:hypothetical protein